MQLNRLAFSLYEPEQTNLILLLSQYQRVQGAPVRQTLDLLDSLQPYLAKNPPAGIYATGAGAEKLKTHLKIKSINEFRALASGVGYLLPDVTTIFEMGGDSSKYIRISISKENGEIELSDYGKNGDCAAGTGSFMDQQARRLLFNIEDVGSMVLQAETAATIAGRCSVFAKSDMIHAQQNGYTPPQILKGLCEAVVRNFKGTILKGKTLGEKIAFVGGVSANKGVVKAMRDIFARDEHHLLVPPYGAWYAAIGAAIEAAKKEGVAHTKAGALNISKNSTGPKITFPRQNPLTMENVTLLRDQTQSFTFDGRQLPVEAFLGIDIGSVTTKLVLIDADGNLIREIYTRTNARPIEVVQTSLRQLGDELGDKIRIKGAATTGSGRELISQFIGADVVKDEITAHKTGATYISETMLNKKVDTIFDIGGQDAKFISIDNGVVVDFTMNEACAAGTGSFLEEQAERLGIQIKSEFSKLALSSKEPIRLGERCTVFMEKVLMPYLQQGASKPDLVAGLAYSIVSNYLNRVVRGRKIGKVIYFQGGTAYNDAVAAAFSTVLNQEVIVPPYNGVIGAIGAALIARDKMTNSTAETRFRGFNLADIDYQLKNFTCRGCANFCEIQQFTVAGEKCFWGNKCSDRYQTTRKKTHTAILPDLIAFRKELMEPYLEPGNGDITIGYPKSMYFFDQLPFWSTYLRRLGYKLEFSDTTNKSIINQGVAATVAEPCFPIIVSHGHTQNLIDRNVDFIFQPNIIDKESENDKVYSFVCPWGQTQPFVFKNTPAFESYWDKFITPTIRFRQGPESVQSALHDTFKKMGISKRQNKAAVQAAYAAQQDFEAQIQSKGRAVLSQMEQSDEQAIILVGRPYNIYDPVVNLNIPGKLRDYYGVNVIPIDFLPLRGIDIADVHDQMFWNYGMRILQAGRFIQDKKNLHLIYLTNFKCGPDSYVKHFIGEVSQKPFLVLQFDGHSNDAGILTRCEAYLDSKDFI